MRDIIARKRPYEPLEMSFDEKLNSMFDRRWTFGTWILAFVGCIGVVAVLILAGNIFLGLN